MQLTEVSLRTQTTGLLIANLLGAALYVFAASRGGWAIPEERAAGIYTTTGEPFIWFQHILPIIAIFLVVNLFWGVKIVTSQRWDAGRSWLLAAAGWVIAIIIDFAHH